MAQNSNGGNNPFQSPRNEFELPKNAKRRNSTGERNPNFDEYEDDSETLKCSSLGNSQKRISWQELNLANLRLNGESLTNNVGKRVAEMFDNPQYADVVFVVGNEQVKVHAHKFVLSISSDVFGAMLNNTRFDQGTLEDVQEVKVVDIEPCVFNKVLKYLYTDQIQFDSDSAMAVLYTAKKYQIKALEKKCGDFLEKNLTIDSAFLLLSQAKLFDQVNLAKACFDLIDLETTEALKTEGFLEISRDTLCDVLRRDTLRIKESEIFDACVKWANAECVRGGQECNALNLRKCLEAALYLIRFPLIDVTEFSIRISENRGILTDTEALNIYLLHHHVNPKPEIPFSCRGRYRVLGKELCISRFQRIESRWGYSGSSDRIKFSVDVPIFVTALGLYGSLHGAFEYETNIEITDFSNNKTVASNETSFKCDGSAGVFRVPFKEPVEILANVTYEVSATIKGPDSHYGSKGLRRISIQSPNGAITFQFSYAHGINNGTSVDDGQIPELIFCMKVI